jgi:hypothetical protein
LRCGRNINKEIKDNLQIGIMIRLWNFDNAELQQVSMNYKRIKAIKAIKEL